MQHSQWESRRLHNEGGDRPGGQTEVSQGVTGRKGTQRCEGGEKAGTSGSVRCTWAEWQEILMKIEREQFSKQALGALWILYFVLKVTGGFGKLFAGC